VTLSCNEKGTYELQNIKEPRTCEYEGIFACPEACPGYEGPKTLHKPTNATASEVALTSSKAVPATKNTTELGSAEAICASVESQVGASEVDARLQLVCAELRRTGHSGSAVLSPLPPPGPGSHPPPSR
jgi:hypothetical protein